MIVVKSVVIYAIGITGIELLFSQLRGWEPEIIML